MKRGYFFDLDGTLVDTHDSNAVAYSRAIREAMPGANVEVDALRRHIVNGEHCVDFMRVLVPGIDGAKIREVAELKARYYPDSIPLSRLNEELIGQIKEWRGSGDAVIALVTTAKRVNARHVLKHHGIGGLFDLTVFGDEVDKLKPAPDIYLRALELSGLEPWQVEAFEDSQSGLDAAHAAGIAVTHVTWLAGEHGG